MASYSALAHIRAERLLRDLVRRRVRQIWAGLPGYDEADVDQWISKIVPLVLSGQRQSVALTEAYLARAVGRQPLGVSTDKLIGAGARNGSPPQEVYRRPFVTVWTALTEGKQWQDAVNAGGARAEGMAAMDVQLSMRDTLRAVGQADDSIWGYQRVADDSACEFCLMVDGAQFKTDDPMPLHNFCGCGAEAIVYTRGVANRNALDAFNASPTPVPPEVAIHEHGELGPVLADPSDHFTKL